MGKLRNEVAPEVEEPVSTEGEVTSLYRLAMESVDANLAEKKVTTSKAVRVREHATHQAKMVRAKLAMK